MILMKQFITKVFKWCNTNITTNYYVWYFMIRFIKGSCINTLQTHQSNEFIHLFWNNNQHNNNQNYNTNSSFLTLRNNITITNSWKCYNCKINHFMKSTSIYLIWATFIWIICNQLFSFRVFKCIKYTCCNYYDCCNCWEYNINLSSYTTIFIIT